MVKGWKRGKTTTAAAPVAETSRAHEQALAVLWWRWRHCYLAARRLQLDKERQQGQGGPS